MKKVLFICTGNICRSPMAEYILRDKLKEHAEWQVASAGVFSMNGSPASLPAIDALKELDIDLRPHRSRMITEDLVDSTTILVAMTQQHQAEIFARFPQARSKTYVLSSFSTSKELEDIPDPIGQSTFVYRMVRDKIDEYLADLALFILEMDKNPPEETGEEQ